MPHTSAACNHLQAVLSSRFLDYPRPAYSCGSHSLSESLSLSLEGRGILSLVLSSFLVHSPKKKKKNLLLSAFANSVFPLFIFLVWFLFPDWTLIGTRSKMIFLCRSLERLSNWRYCILQKALVSHRAENEIT